MRPVLFTFFDFPIYSHGVFFLLALLVGGLWLFVEARRRRWQKEEVIPITLAAFIGGMMGARLSMIFFAGWQVAPLVLNFYNLFDPRIGPGSVLGAVAGAYVAGYIASRLIGKKDCACDAFAPAMALAMMVGRIGDFLAAEDGLGKPTTLPWGVPVNGQYLNGTVVPTPGVSFLAHPTPLYDAAFNLLWFCILILLRDHPRMQNGNLLKFGLAGYAFFRFFVEFVRNNQVLVWGLTGQQLACVLLLVAIGAYYWREWRKQLIQVV